MTTLALNAQACTISVPFHGAELYVVNHNSEPYTPMKPIVEGMGMDWASQFIKLKQRFSKGIVEITIPSSGGAQSMICLALRKLSAWLNTISPNKVKPEIRDTVIRYQKECDDVLYEYWTKGVAVNPRKQVPASGKISAEHQVAIKNLVMSRGEGLPREKRGKAIITMWSALKAHFGITYKEISDHQFEEAISLVSRLPLEGEILPAPIAAPNPILFPAGKPFRYVTDVAEDGSIVSMSVLRNDEFVMSVAGHTEMLRRAGNVVIFWQMLSKLTSEQITRLWMDAKDQYLENIPF